MPRGRKKSKSSDILESLKAAIADGQFPVGERIPAETQLAADYGVSKNTVREAVTVLVQAGILRRRQGSGTYVAATATAQAPERIALFMRTYGHVNAGQVRALVTTLQQQGAIPMVFDVDEYRGEDGKIDTAMLSNVLAQDIDGVILEGTAEWLLTHCRARDVAPPTIALINQRYSGAQTDMQVLTDFAQGTYLGAKHLLELGHQNILFVVHQPPPHVANAQYEAILRGHRQALTEAGLEDQIRYLFLRDDFRTEVDNERLTAVLAAENRPSAVFAFEDFRAKCVMDVARKLGLRVPDDLAVLGYFDTPWCDMTDVPLSSVSIAEEEIAQATATQLLRHLRDQPDAVQMQQIEPRLVVRRSCGGKATVNTPTKIHTEYW